jgi:hypothetical protein
MGKNGWQLIIKNINMKQLLPLFLFLVPCLAWAQYPSNGNQKITLGEQTTADGLIFRGVAADTTLTAKSDTAAYFVLDTVNINLYTYKVSASGKKWRQLGADTAAIAYVNTYGDQTVNGAKTFTNSATFSSTFTGNPSSGSSDVFKFKTTGNTGNGVLYSYSDGTGVANGIGSNLSVSSSGVISRPNNTLGAWAIDMNNRTNPSIQIYYINPSGTFSIPFKIDSFSNVGIGTGTITERLHVDGNGLFTGNLGVGGVTPTSRLHVKGVDGTSSNSSLNVTNSSNTSLLFVRNDGNVGIGTATPIAKLDVGYDNTNRSIGRFTSNAANRGAYITFFGNNAESSTFGYEGGSEIVGGGQQGDFVLRNVLLNKNIIFTTNNGKFGVNVLVPTEALHVVGNARITAVGAGAFSNNLNITSDGTLTTATSDEKFKYNIRPLNYGLETLLQLNPVNFQWIEGEEEDLGFIAQDVAEIIPEAVNTNWNSDLLFRYESLIPILTKAIQEQNLLIKALEQRIINLENK